MKPILTATASALALVSTIVPALATYTVPTATAVPGPVAGIGLPVLGAWAAYKLYRHYWH